jgi:hypothetical protein
MARRHVYDYGPPGRPKVSVEPEPPRDFSRLNALMLRPDVRGWYRELAKRQRRQDLKANPPPLKKGRPIRDPLEMDRVMCRTDVVAECKDETDLDAALFNKRIVLAIDPNCPSDLLFKKIGAILDEPRNRHSRRINTKHWAEHRILMLYDLELMGHDTSKERKQLAQWLFPEVRSQKSRGDKFDRAMQYLDGAKELLPALRAQSTR